MRIGVISYSMTGNNEALAAKVADRLGAEHIRVSEPQARTNGTVAFDMLLGRVPKVQPAPDRQDDFGLLLFVAPVWMGQAASPLRAYLSRIRKMPRRFAFISISGGADGENPGLTGWLEKRAGRAPEAVIDLHIADLLPAEPKPTRSDTSAYRLSDAEADKLAETVVRQLGDITAAS